MRRGADVPEVVDRRLVPRHPPGGPPQQVLVERARAGVDVAADEVAVEALEIGGREHDALDRRALEVRDLRAQAADDAIGVGLAQRLASRCRRRRRSRRARRRWACGSSCSWIQRIARPAGARLGSTAQGWPTTIVASAGSRPRSASLTARETPSSPGVTCTMAVRASRSASGEAHAAARPARGGSACRRGRSGSPGPSPRPPRASPPAPAAGRRAASASRSRSRPCASRGARRRSGGRRRRGRSRAGCGRRRRRCAARRRPRARSPRAPRRGRRRRPSGPACRRAGARTR